MEARFARWVSSALEAFVALTAVGGGLLLVLGVDRFPAEWLGGSPFSDYVIPGLVLALVGAVSAVAAVASFRRLPWAADASVAAGAVLVGWIAGEVLLIHRNGAAEDPRSPTEAIYAAIGMVMVALGAIARLRGERGLGLGGGVRTVRRKTRSGPGSSPGPPSFRDEPALPDLVAAVPAEPRTRG